MSDRTKTCSKCGEEKNISFFHKSIIEKDGHTQLCKKCHHVNNKKPPSAERKMLLKIGMKRCPLCGEVKAVSEYTKNRHFKSGLNCKCRNCKSITYKERRAKRGLPLQTRYTKEAMAKRKREQVRGYYYKNKENPSWHEKRKTECAEYRAKNRDKIREIQRRYRARKLEKQGKTPCIRGTLGVVNRRIIKALRARIYDVLIRQKNGTKKYYGLWELTGCCVEDLKMYIEGKFQKGMTWENYGREGWHIDHIIPCSYFNLHIPEEQKKCFHYTNLQPLWRHENLSKGAKLNWHEAKSVHTAA